MRYSLVNFQKFGTSSPINPFYATNTLFNLVEANADSENSEYYGSYFTELLKLVGSASDANKQLGVSTPIVPGRLT